MAKNGREENTPSMWVRYRILLYFVAGLVALDALVASGRRVWLSYDPDDYAERLARCQARSWDFCIVGGSPVSEGIDPTVLGGMCHEGQVLEHGCNLGLPGATTSDVWHAARHGLVTPPKLLLYGITASDLNDNRFEPHGIHALMDSNDMVDWVQQRPETAQWVGRRFITSRLRRVWQVYRYRNGIRLWAADRCEHFWPGSFPQTAREAREGLRYAAAMQRADGFAPQPAFQNMSYEQFKAWGGTSDLPFGFLKNYRLGEHLRYLHRLIDWSDSQGIELVLIDMPVTADLEEVRFPVEFASYRKALAEVERSRNIRVLRASRGQVGLNDGDFADLIHLNARGTAHVSLWLRQALEVEVKGGLPQ